MDINIKEFINKLDITLVENLANRIQCENSDRKTVIKYIKGIFNEYKQSVNIWFNEERYDTYVDLWIDLLCGYIMESLKSADIDEDEKKETINRINNLIEVFAESEDDTEEKLIEHLIKMYIYCIDMLTEDLKV